MDRTIFSNAGPASESKPHALSAALRTLSPPRRRDIRDPSQIPQPTCRYPGNPNRIPFPQAPRDLPTAHASEKKNKDQTKSRAILSPAGRGLDDLVWALLFAALAGSLPLPALRILVWSYIFFSLVGKWIEAYQGRRKTKSLGSKN